MLCCAKRPQLCPTLCNSTDCNPPGSFVHGIRRARILDWVAVPSSRGSSWLRDQTCVSYVSCTGRWTLYHERHFSSFAQSCLTLCDPMNRSTPDLPVPHQLRSYRSYIPYFTYSFIYWWHLGNFHLLAMMNKHIFNFNRCWQMLFKNAMLWELLWGSSG